MYILFLYIYIHIIYIYIYLYIDISHVDLQCMSFSPPFSRYELAVCARTRPGVTGPPAPRFSLLSCAALPEAVEDRGFLFLVTIQTSSWR